MRRAKITEAEARKLGLPISGKSKPVDKKKTPRDKAGLNLGAGRYVTLRGVDRLDPYEFYPARKREKMSVEIATQYGPSGEPLGGLELTDYLDLYEWTRTAISDAFFNCNLVNDASSQDEEEITSAAHEFNRHLPEGYRSRYSVKWLVSDFYERL